MARTKYRIRVKEFEGPFELLLGLIEERKLSINEVSLGAVTEEYLQRLGDLKSDPDHPYHEEVAAFLVVAATLMLIKSRSLLPGFMVTPEEESDIRELESRLHAYKAIKEMARRIGEVAAKGERQLFTRSPYVLVAPSFLPPSKPIEAERLLQLLRHTLNSIPKKDELPQKTIKQIISIEEKIKELERRIQDGIVKTFDEFVGHGAERANVVVSFLAMLELIKLGSIAVQQSGAFGTIHINHGTRKEN